MRKWPVILHLAVEGWLAVLDRRSLEQVTAAIDLLAEQGPVLRRPLVGEVQASRHKNMKELRPGSAGRSEIPIVFAFDPQQQAILLVAGDKAGKWQRWYKQNVPLADDRFDEHLEQTRRDDG